jgi:dTDP-4-dehydrorhamnose 3,5-epimerase
VRFTAAEIPGVFVLEPDRFHDERGWFARTWAADELGSRGLEAALAQCSASFNARRGTLRGMHYQAPPAAEVKVVRCTRGAVFDVAVDLRPDAPTFLRWTGVELSAENGRGLYLPRGFGHGFLTLADATEVAYFISAPYTPAAARGVRWDDPSLGIRWPGPVEVISQRDRDYPDLDPAMLSELKGLRA